MNRVVSPARQALRFGEGAVASPNYLASMAGLEQLARGGNAMDAAIATSLTLGVVSPYMCGYGGDIFAMVFDADGVHGYNGSGRAPMKATVESVRRAAGETPKVPSNGPLAVTVPGAVRGWFDLVDRFGTRPFEELAARPLRHARDGFPLTRRAELSLRGSLRRFTGGPEFDEHHAIYSRARAGTVFTQPGLARTISALSEHGPDVYYRGEIASAIASTLQGFGAFMEESDLDAHTGDWVTPMSTTYRDVQVLEMPPNTQGVCALQVLNIASGLDLGEPESAERHHLLAEACRLAMLDRETYVTDPAHMTIDPAELASADWAAKRRAEIDPDRAGPTPAGIDGDGGTIYLCAADASGMCVSLIQSNFRGFGSGVTVPGWGINLHNRGWSFSLQDSHVNVIAPGKRPMHTLIPAMAMRAGKPALVFGTMGGHGQFQTHAQILTRWLDDRRDIQEAIDEPRWQVNPATWELDYEPRFDPATIDGLAARGHRVRQRAEFSPELGHAHAIAIDEAGFLAATDCRSEGAAAGL